jgi:hypothetical protein
MWDNVLDVTYGRGTWWTSWTPERLTKNDLHPDLGDYHYDARLLPWAAEFDMVAFDPPYKLSGTPALGDFDDRYGIDVPTRWQDRMDLILDGAEEAITCAKAKGHLLVKCQDQVVSGKMVWQTMEVWHRLAPYARLVDRFDMRPWIIPPRFSASYLNFG